MTIAYNLPVCLYSREYLHKLAQRTRDPDALSASVLEQMWQKKVGPFAHDWSEIEALFK